MTTTRRQFLDHLALGAATLGGLPLALGAAARTLDAAPARHNPSEWDLSWVERLNGKHKTILDVPEVESGYGVWRATIWAKQYQDVLGIPAGDLSTAVVLRHNGIVLAMQQRFWDRYGIGKTKKVTHPVTLKPTSRNPALLSSARNEVPADYDAFALDKLLARGAVVLACDLALQDCIGLIQTTDKVSPEAARKQAIEMLVPGVILQPSGVFAVIRAQEAGCSYVRAS
jgi:hypothetical protein